MPKEQPKYSPKARPKDVVSFDRLLTVICGSCLFSFICLSWNFPVHDELRRSRSFFRESFLTVQHSKQTINQDSRNELVSVSMDDKPQNASISLKTFLPKWIQDYFSWHKNSLENLKSNHSVWMQYKYLVVRCLKIDHKCGGASDRLQSIPLALLLASQSERLLFIEWEKPAQLTEFLEPVALDWRIPRWLIGNVRNDTFLTFQRSPTILSDKHFYRLQSYSDRILLDMRYQTTDHGKGYFDRNQDGPDFEQVYSTLWSLMFQPSKSVQVMIDTTRAALGLLDDYVSLHVRSLYFKDKSGNIAQIENALNCAARLRTDDDQSILPTIFVASDSPAVLDFATQYGTKTMHRKVVARTNNMAPPLHLDRGSNFLSPVDSENRWMDFPPGAYYNIFVDLYLLSFGQCISYNLGGYGQWASLISHNKRCGSINHRATLCSPDSSQPTA